MARKTTTDALKILAQMAGKDPARQRMLEEELANAEVAVKIYRLRHEAGLSQVELAKKVGTTQSVISRLEDADYEGHSLAMLNRIASALERKVEIRFVPRKRRVSGFPVFPVSSGTKPLTSARVKAILSKDRPRSRSLAG
jgi:transcriptional regulator with XRE-family HTH domain